MTEVRKSVAHLWHSTAYMCLEGKHRLESMLCSSSRSTNREGFLGHMVALVFRFGGTVSHSGCTIVHSH